MSVIEEKIESFMKIVIGHLKFWHESNNESINVLDTKINLAHNHLMSLTKVYIKGVFTDLGQFLATESALKMIKNDFYFL